MHKEILTSEQIKLLPLLKLFSKNFGLVGGMAIALYIGHRESIDFDLFTFKEFENIKIKRKISKLRKIDTLVRDETGQYTIITKGVRFTFFHYPFEIDYPERLDNYITLPNLLTLSAMKAYALGRRAKWKDYVDLYFIIKDHFSVNEIVKKAGDIFHNEFNEKIFRTQLAYFKDIDYTEKVIYTKKFKVNDKVVKQALIDFSLRY